jgi:hypothetical protein
VPSVTRSSCTHDLGPGTTVCLRCRQEQREKARTRQQRMLLRTGLAMATLLVVGMGGASAMSAWRSPTRSQAPEPLRLLASTTVQQQGIPRSSGEASIDVAPAAAIAHPPVTAAGSPPSTSARVLSAAAVPASVPAAARRSPRSLALVIPTGRTDLTDSVYVERMADSAVVHFDTEIGRTRRRDKFEQIVRATLPALYGARAESLLVAVPVGELMAGRDLLTEVVAKGIRLPLAGGDTLEIWPQSRPGQDGPLVVSYRARVLQLQ